MSSDRIAAMKWLWERIEKHGFLAILLTVMIVRDAYREYVHDPKVDVLRQLYVAEQMQLSRTHFDKVLEAVKDK